MRIINAEDLEKIVKNYLHSYPAEMELFLSLIDKTPELQEKQIFEDLQEKAKKYQELTDALKSVYGDCDGLLEIAVNHLVKHEGASFEKPQRAILLTDEDADRWETLKKIIDTHFLNGEVTDLDALRKVISRRIPFLILNDYTDSSCTGQKRKPSIFNNDGFYSVVLGDPEHRISKSNHRKGAWTKYGKASDWSFANGVCTQYVTIENVKYPIWDIKFDKDIVWDILKEILN